MTVSLSPISLHSAKNPVDNTSYMLELRYPLTTSFKGQYDSVLFLRLDQAVQVERAAKNLKERLAIRSPLYNGLSSGEIASGRVEHLDPVEGTLFLLKRHWKRNQICSIDRKTVMLQIRYSGDRKRGPLLRSNKGGHYSREGIYYLVKSIAKRTNIPCKENINPRTLKRTFAREWLRSGGTVGSLQKQFSHKHLWSTAHYLRFVMNDVHRNHDKMMNKIEETMQHD